MINLIIDNSTCQLTGLSFGHWKKLRELCSYQIDSRTAYFSSARSNTRYLMDKKGSFPTGLLYLVQEYLFSDEVPERVEVVDRRKRPEPRTGLFKIKLEGYGDENV